MFIRTVLITLGALILVTVAISATFFLQSDDHLSAEEGFLYSAIGCTSVYKKLDQPQKTENMLNLIHNFSAEQGILETRPGFLSRFIKLVERKWEKDHETAKKNCDGIYEMAIKSTKPSQYNAVAQSVIQYMWDLESNKRPDLTEKTPDK